MIESFENWKQVRENTALNIGKGVMGTASATGDEQRQLEDLFSIAKHAIEHHPADAIAFLRRMGAKDPFIQQRLDQINDRGFSLLRRASRKGPDEGDQIVGSVADGQTGGTVGGAY